MEPAEYLRALRRRWWLLAVAAVAAIVATMLITPSDAEKAQASQRYRAAHTIALEPVSGLSGTKAKTARIEVLAASARLFRSPELAQRVASALDLDGDPEALGSQVQIETDKKRGSLTFATTGKDRAGLKELADTYAEEGMAYQVELDEASYEGEVEKTAARVETLTSGLNELGAQADQTESASLKATREALAGQLTAAIARQSDLTAQGPPVERFTTVSEAKPVLVTAGAGTDAFGPPESRRGRVLLALGLALALAGALVLVMDRSDTRLRSRAMAEHAFGLPVLAEVPFITRKRRRDWTVATATHPVSSFAEAYRGLRSAIMLAPAVPRLMPVPAGRAADGGDGATTTAPATASGEHAYELRFDPLSSLPDGVKVILVVSAGAGEGKSTTVANLAASFAETGRSVLVIDCDLRQPSLHHLLLDTQARLGLSDVLVERGASYRLSDVARPTRLAGVRLVASGTPTDNPAGLMTEAREVLLRCRGAADVIIVDTPPSLVVNDAAELVPAADAVIVVARKGRTTAAAARRTAEMFARLGARVFGVTLIGVTGRRGASRFSSSADGGGAVPPQDTSSGYDDLSPVPARPLASEGPTYEEPETAFLMGELTGVTPDGPGRSRRQNPFRRGR